MPRPQFSIRTLLWLTLAVACFFGGMAFEKERVRREWERNSMPPDAPFLSPNWPRTVVE